MQIDLTGFAVASSSALFSIVSAVFLAWLQSHLKDKEASATIAAAIQNSLGAMQQAATTGLVSLKPVINIPNVPPSLAAGVQYVLDNAGPELKRYTNLTPEIIAGKIDAQLGLANIATNIATASSPGPSPAPLAPVATETPDLIVIGSKL